jgi:hypothetical protein
MGKFQIAPVGDAQNQINSNSSDREITPRGRHDTFMTVRTKATPLR